MNEFTPRVLRERARYRIARWVPASRPDDCIPIEINAIMPIAW
jgi:hypothetical protein